MREKVASRPATRPAPCMAPLAVAGTATMLCLAVAAYGDEQ
jgi:hypothetical protein